MPFWWQSETTLVTLLNSSMCWKRMPLLCSNFVFASGARFAIVFVSSEYKQYRYLQQLQRYIFVILSLYVCKKLKNARSVENGLQWAWALRNMCLLTLGRCILNVRSVDQVFHRKVLWRFTCKIILGRNLYMSVVLKGVFSLCYVEETYIDPY